MKDDLLERLRAVDPVSDEQVVRGSRALGGGSRRIVDSEPTDARRRYPASVQRKVTLAAVAVVVVVAIAVPLTLLRPLGDGDATPDGGTGSSAVVPDSWVTVGSLAEIEAQGITYVPTPGARTAGAFVIARGGRDPYALSATPMEDPRAATRGRVVYCPAEGGMFVGSLGDVYSASGDVIEGPADHGLASVGLRVHDGSVQIDPEDLTSGSATVRAESVRVGCETAGTAPLEGTPGFGIPAGTALPPIAVALPQSGMTLFGTAHIVGSADVFEATVSIKILDARGRVIAESVTTATCGTGCRGDYATDLVFSVDHRQPGTVQVFEVSAKDGSMINTVEVPVTLSPSRS
jgi:hypothetical protein